MSSLVEFHVCSLWGLQPIGVRRIISQLKQSGFEKAEFLFDQRRNWFQITCQVEDELEIKKVLKQYLEEFEEEVLDEGEDLVDGEGALVKSMDNGKNFLIGLWDENALLEAVDFTEFRLPSAFEDLPHSEVWDSLSYGRLGDLLSKDQFQEIHKQHDIIMATNHSRTEVYLGAMNKKELDLVRAKLDVLLNIKELKDSEPTHLLWTEAYKEKEGFEMTFDTRFLSNIDPAFIGATYLDLGPRADSVEDYEMLAEAITLRLCRYDENRACHTSLIGPKIKSRGGASLKVGGRRYTVRDRAGARKKLFGAGIGAMNPACIGPERKDAVAEPTESPYEGGEVETWLDQLEESYGIATPSSNQGAGAAAELPSALGSNTLVGLDGPADSLASHTAGQKSYERSLSHNLGLLDLDDPFIASEPVSGPVTFPMGPLKRHDGNSSTTSASKARNAGSHSVEGDVEAQETSRAGGAAAASKRNASRGSSATHASTARKSTARPETAAAQLAPWFILDINTAVRNLVAAGPYLRGKVSLRADLGRILITGMDYTALAFNGPGSESNGWKKDTLLGILNQGSRSATGHGVTFTKMLTQDGDDIEYMLGTTDIATGTQLWKCEATERVVYSFYCVSKGQSFLMDLEVDESGSKFNYSLRTKQDDKPPIWVHCTLRSWDARLVLSHVDTHALEATYGEFARSFVNSFAVTVSEDNHPHVQVGVHRGFGVSVESMRINTSFRVLSADERSYLDITEVEETVFKACSPLSETADHVSGPASTDECMFYIVNPKRLPTDVHNSDECGMPTFWYEASVRSVAGEKEMVANQTVGLGEKAPWDFGKLSELSVVASICKPTLRMVQVMDTAGANNDNHQAAKLVLPRENTEDVPGANYPTNRGSSVSSSSSRPRIPLSSPATLVQTSGPPGVVIHRPSSRDCPTPPSTVPSPKPVPARVAAAGPSPVRKLGEALKTQNNNQNIINNFAPGAANGGGGGFGVTAPRGVSRPRAPARRDPSSAGSDASRAPAASCKPPPQFW